MHLMVFPTSSVGMTGTVCAMGAPDASTMGDQDDLTNPIQNETLSNDITINMKLNQRVRISAVKILDPILQEA